MEKRKVEARPWVENRIREDVPEICKDCGNYLPMFHNVIDKECDVFGTTDGVKNNACGARTRRFSYPIF